MISNVLESNNTLKSLLYRDREYLSEARLLLMHILNLTRSDLIAKSELTLDLSQLEQYNNSINQVREGFPVSLILGVKEFYSREFHVTRDTLIPRPETELLVEYVLNLVNKSITPINSILDLGTGSGCIAVTLSLELKSPVQIVAVDINPDTLNVAMDNAKSLDADVQFIQSDWLENIQDKFDIIVSNPPYIAADDKYLANLTYEPLSALTDHQDGYSCIRHIINHAVDYLKRDGYLLIEHGFEQKDIVQQMYQDRGYLDIVTIQDYAGLDRFTVGKYKGKNSE